jgi:hypothetical protein
MPEARETLRSKGSKVSESLPNGYPEIVNLRTWFARFDASSEPHLCLIFGKKCRKEADGSDCVNENLSTALPSSLNVK